MSYQYHERGGPRGVPNPGVGPPPSGRRTPQGHPSQSDRHRRPPPMRPGHHGGGPPPMRYPNRPPPQQYGPPPPLESTESLYDGSAYGGDEYEQPEQWPLPARPFAPPSERSSPNSNSSRRPPQRPQRPDYQEPILDPPRPSARIAPANRAYHLGPPRPSHHGNGRWTGDGYSRSPESQYAPPNPPRQPSPAGPGPVIPDYQMPQPLHQAVYGRQNQRAPLGPPPSARRGPPSYFPQIAPVHPIAEETDSLRGSIRNASTIFGDPAHSSYASSNAIPIGVPAYYVQDRGSARSFPDHARTDSFDERPRDSTYDSGRESGIESPSPEPAALIRQASLGKKSKPTLTTVKSHERARKESIEKMRKESNERIRNESSGHGVIHPLNVQRNVPHSGMTEEPRHDSEDQYVGSPNAFRSDSGARVLTPGGLPSGAITGMPGGFPTTPALEKETRISQLSDSDYLSDDDESPEKSNHLEKALEEGGGATLGAAAVGTGYFAARPDTRNKIENRTPSSGILSSGTGLLDPSSSESESETKQVPSKERLGTSLGKEQQQRSKPRSPLAPPDPKAEAIRDGLEKGGALSPTNSLPQDRPISTASDVLDKKRPPRLDIDAVRDAEARGSTTSLTDLIRRATKLASNLDRGKTASRLGMNFFEGSESDEEKWRRLDAANRATNRRSGSISDILASFPPPRTATPPGSGAGVRRSFGNWSSNLRHSQLPSDSDAGEIRRKQKRKCCGLPVWLFVLLLILVFLLVAAAVLVPVMLLIVIPNMHNDSNGGTSAALASCQKKLTCENGGTNVLSNDNVCRCLCVNGYTGATCNTRSMAGCTTISVGGTTDATVGEDIPGVLKDAKRNFGIPLDGQTLLGLFSSASMSCNAENELVTFKNVAQRAVDPTRRGLDAPTRTYQNRQARSASTSGTPASSSSASSATPGTSTNLNFARVAVLYIFQDSGEATSAVTAQENLQSYFSDGQTTTGQVIDPNNISLGNGYWCDLPSSSLILSNGTTVGG